MGRVQQKQSCTVQWFRLIVSSVVYNFVKNMEYVLDLVFEFILHRENHTVRNISLH